MVHFTGCINSQFPCDLSDSSAVLCTACGSHKINMIRGGYDASVYYDAAFDATVGPSPEEDRAGLIIVPPKTAEQLREEYFKQLIEELKNGMHQ